MKSHTELLSHFYAFHVEIKNQFNVSIKTLRTDNAGEYFSHTLGSYLCEHGIIHQSSCVDTQSQNGIAEHKNRHVLETAHALLFQMHVLKTFWGDVVSTTCFLINRMPSSLLNGEISYRDTLFTSSPSSSCQGEDDNLSIYEITSPTDAPPSRLLPSRVYFRRPPSQPSGSCHTSVPSSSCDPGPSDDLLITLRKGKRKCTYPVSSFVFYHQLSSPTYAFITSLESTSISNTVHEALSHLGWRNAMIEEMTALDDNGTWDLVSLPGGKKAISCKWVFSVKVNLDGTVTQLKAHLVAKGYAQTYGINYSDTFSPVAKLTSIRLFLSMAATHNWSLDQLDIKNDFLHGDLQEEVYMEQPLGFIAQGESDKVCRLRKSLYGLKQGPHAWFGKFSHALIRFGMQKSTYDHYVFFIVDLIMV
ncbi:hypothetical protein IC582_001289 [Cucumis melo]